MTSQEQETSPEKAAKSILARFAHLLSAYGIDGVLQAAFFLYLAWVDKAVFGELVYALAVGSIVMELVRFGLYYPLVGQLGEAQPHEAAEIMNRANIIKALLLIPALIGVWGMIYYRGFPSRMAWIVFVMSAGVCLEVLADTFFAYLRVMGLQKQEAQIRIGSGVSSYGFGLGAAVVGLNPIIVASYRLLSGLIQLVFGLLAYLRANPSNLLVLPEWRSVREMFRLATVFAVIQLLGTFYNQTNILWMEKVVGVNGVASYGASFNLINGISAVVSMQLLGAVVFPLLTLMWWKDRDAVGPIVTRTAKWLMAAAFPIMFFLSMESELIIGLVYPAEYKDAVWVQKYLVWLILCSFESNLFAYLMMVAGEAKRLLAISVIVTIANLILNMLLVEPYGLAGGCLVIVLTRTAMALLTFLYCQLRFRLFKPSDFLFPTALALVSLGVFFLTAPIFTYHVAVFMALGCYAFFLWRFGERFMGPLTEKPAP